MYNLSASVDHILEKNSSLLIPHPLECLNISVCTICSLSCRFCAYEQSLIARETMPETFFYDIVNEATQFGYRTFNLTPIIGEPLLDKGFLKKLKYLEEHPRVKFYSFCSNLTHVENSFLNTLVNLKKLRWFSVSLYGLNYEDFQKMTGASQNVYTNIVKNLEKLSRLKSLAGHYEIRLRGPGNNKKWYPRTKCADILRQLEKNGVQIRSSVRFMNWGGLIKDEDVKELDIYFKKIDRYRKSPCVFIFHKPTVLPNGSVNACSCGDANSMQVIGNLTHDKFTDILSYNNTDYMRILINQFSGDFSEMCKACSGYRPLEQNWYSYRYYDRNFISLRDFFLWLSKRLDL